MTERRRRLATVMEECLPHYCEAHPLSPRQWQVCHHLLACGTEALGDRQLQCERCGHEVSFYHSCRDRHCSACQQRASRDWCERQSAHTLEVAYHHLVLTLPESLNPWVELHPEVIYDQLLKSTWETLRTFGADPKRLDGQLGATLVLHTWGQTLTRHLHVHCLVPGGALTEQGTWRAVRGEYLFPVRALSRYFRGHFVRSLRARYRHGALSRIEDPKTVSTLLDALMAQDWVVKSQALPGAHRSRGGLSGPLHPAHCAEREPPARLSRRRGGARLPGLPRAGPAQSDAPERRGADQTVPAPCSTQKLHAYPSLRLPGQSLPSAEAHADPR